MTTKHSKTKPQKHKSKSKKYRAKTPGATKMAKTTEPKGTLVIIGGHEDKTGRKDILCEVSDRVRNGPLVIATVASTQANELWPEYKKIFTDLGVREVVHLDINDRAQATDEKSLECVNGARGVFFTGGDQLKITSQLGGTKICDLIRKIYYDGGVIAGTSAGAAAMSSTMIVSGPSDSTVKAKGDVAMAPGLDLVDDIIVDQHFSERGRLSRLLGALALNPRYLGVGIDEDTAVVVYKRNMFRVLGRGSVYVLDAQAATRLNISEVETDLESNLSIYGVRLSMLNEGEIFDTEERRPAKQKRTSRTH